MITEGQLEYILDLYKQVDMEPEVDLEELTQQEASDLIDELLDIKREIK